MLDPYQVVEAKVIGADCILLIMAALSDARGQGIGRLARDLGLDVLVEVHDEAELDRALMLEARLIGINNRNLKTLQVDLKTTETLAPRVPDDRLLVAESGLYEHQDSAAHGRDRGALLSGGGSADAQDRCRGGNATASRDRGGIARSRRPGGMSELTHFDGDGNAVMVDVGAKEVTERVAIASGKVLMETSNARSDPRTRPEEGRRAERRSTGRDHGRQAHPRSDPALPPALPLLGQGRAVRPRTSRRRS